MNTKVSGEQKPLNIRLLGPPEASLERHPFRFGTRKALALLCYLAAEGGRHPRRQLAELLWPQSDERHARTDLRSALAKLRKTLGEDGTHSSDTHEQRGRGRFIVVDGDLLGVEPTEVELDLRALEGSVSLARRQISSQGESSADAASALGRRELIGTLQGALGLYRGEFMEGFSLEDAPEFELWLEGERGSWRRVLGELCERLSRLEGEEGLIAEALGTARLWVRHAPLEEAAHRRLMELLSGAGESERALLVYEGFKNTLSRALGMEPSSPLQHLAGRLREEVEERASLGASLIHPAATAAAQLSVLEVPLVGRQEEFGALVSEYHSARMGQTRVAVVLGEAGIGKTRLVEEFLLWARAREADVLKGGASEGAGLPYGPVVEAIRPRIERERAPDDLLEDVWLSELCRLLPELKERYPDLHTPTSSSGEGEVAKGALFEAIARLVGNLASRAPVVLFLDDLEWADAATLEVLDYASKRWAEQGAPVLLLIAARPGEPEVSTTFERWLWALGRRLPVRSLTLGPLGEEDVKGLLGRLATGAGSSKPPAGALEEPEASNGEESGLTRLGERLAAETDGQPFYLVETLKALLEVGLLLVRSHADGEPPVVEVGPAWRSQKSALRGLLPQSVREVIRSRLSRLSPAGSELLRAGAVLERGFSFETLVGVAGLGGAEGLRGLDELIERHLLQEEESGSQEEEAAEETLLHPSPTYSFTHEKIRQVAYTESGHARRRLLHRRAFEVLGESSAPAAQLAHQALAGGLAKPAFRYLVAAGDQAMELFAAQDAIENYQRARSLLAEEVGVRTGTRQLAEPSIANLEHLYIQLGRAHELADEWGKARAVYEALLALGRELGEARLEVLSLNHLATLTFYHEADPSKAKAFLEEARGVAEEAGLKEALVETECNLADVMTLLVSEYEHSAPFARKALASARALGERPDLVARALLTLVRLERFRGRL